MVRFVTVAFDEGDPVFLVSTMAEHTRNLQRDQRASLMVAEGGATDPLANGRVTLLGDCERVEGGGGNARTAFLATHPNATYYADFGDFAFWKLHVASIRYIGGYGRMSWVDADDWYAANPDPLAAVADGIIAHMNKDHSDSMVLYCEAFSKATEITAATMTGVDRYGVERCQLIPLMDPGRSGWPFQSLPVQRARFEPSLVAMLKMARLKLSCEN